MAEVQQPARSSQSYIPVFTPRKSQCSQPSNHHVGFAPTSRHLSVSGSPTHPSPSSTSSSTSGGLTPFRSFRNLFSSGSTKNTPNAPKSPFSGFGSIRRSMHGERSVSAPHLRRQSSCEDSPVLSIALPHPGTEPLINGAEFANLGLNATPSDPPSSRSSAHASTNAASDGASSPAVGPTDLSTIIEAENSGISKHIPILDDSREEEAEVDNFLGNSSHQEVDFSLLHVSTHQPASHNGARTPSSKESSELDLSTSKVTNEVLQAMSATGRTEGWLHGVVVDDAGDDVVGSDALAAHGAAGDPDVSFNLSALDPDLAALLSPNRLAVTEPALLVAIDSVHSPAPSTAASRRRPSPLLPSAPINSGSPHRSSFSATPTSSRNPSPVRRQAPLPKFGTPNLPSTSLPRPGRSVSDRATLQRTSIAPPALSSLGRAISHSPERPSTTGALRSPPTSYNALTNEDHRPHTSGGSDSRRPALSHLLTPARSGTHLTPGSSSRPPSRQFTRTPPRTWEPAPRSPIPRPASSAGTSSSRLQQSHSTLDVGSDRLEKPARSRNRERSASVVEYSGTREPTRPSSRPTAEWLGPRTAKAFAAAGLLDYDGDARRPSSRFGTARSSIDDSRSRYVPSRMAFSEAGSSSSWSRRSGSISRAGSLSRTVTDVGGPMSESVSTPRTTFSSGSTAPTSISASSSAHQHLHSELQLLQERHSVETGALLSALADSQRTARVLRDENTQLRDRLQDVEDRLAAAMEQIHQLQYTPPSQLPLTASRSGLRGYPSRSSERQNGIGQSRLHSFLRPEPDVSPEPSSPEPANPSPETPSGLETFMDTRRKRISTSSSLFPGPPSNMSMLMHEDGVSVDHSGAFSTRADSPSSPTLVLAKLDGARYGHKRTASSTGNISPTTANFSIVTGSPGSLNLRPEHELHLGDMPSLDLQAEYDGDAYDDGEL